MTTVEITRFEHDSVIDLSASYSMKFECRFQILSNTQQSNLFLRRLFLLYF
jgi:hypothetical protein